MPRLLWQYPGRDNSLTGGFAGGEEGLRAFLDTGDVPLAAGGDGRRQQSPLIVAGVVALAATGGGLLLDSLEEVGQEAVSGAAGGVPSAATMVSGALAGSLDDTTRLLLEAAVLLIGVAGTVAGGRALVAAITKKMGDTLSRLATLSFFWLAVFVSAKLLLEN